MPRNDVAIVTGGARGIGLATARRMASRRLRVAVIDVDEHALAEAPLPAGTLRIVANVADDPDEWIADVEAGLGVPTVLVNNVAHMDGRSFLELPMDVVRQSLNVTMLGTWQLTRSVVKRMIANGSRGSVVFNLSLHASRVRMSPDYSASKAALSMLMRELAAELGPHGIRVNAVSPGAVDTWSDRASDPERLRERSEALVPLGRLGQPDDVAKAIDFLADPKASGYVTGADLKVDGGLDQFNWLHHLYGTAAAERDQTSGDPDQAGRQSNEG